MTKQLAGCIILDQQGRVLLIHRNTEKLVQWELPGGKVEPDESLEAAAVREVAEEAGMAVEIVREVGQADFDDNGTTWEYHWFLATIVTEEPSIGEPATFDAIRYFDLDTLTDAAVSINIRNLKAALKSGQATL